MFRRISSFLASEVKVEGRKLGNFCVEVAMKTYFQDERKRQLAERDDGEDGERNEAARVVYSTTQLLLFTVGKLAAFDQLPE